MRSSSLSTVLTCFLAPPTCLPRHHGAVKPRAAMHVLYTLAVLCTYGHPARQNNFVLQPLPAGDTPFSCSIESEVPPHTASQVLRPCRLLAQ